MYTCDRCNKSYSSERRYNSHIERCALHDLDDDARSVKSYRSSSSRKSNAISDIQSEYSEDTQLDLDKLLREKTKLKSNIKKYARELQRVRDASRSELERCQEYFNQQIIDLTEERNQLVEDISTSRDELFLEKERLRDEFNKKLIGHKDQLERRYSSSSNKQIKHLNDMITKLQRKLDEQLEEKEQLKESLEDYYSQKDEKLRNQVEKHQEELQKVKSAFESERNELKRIAQTCSMEKDAYKMKCDTERDKEIQNILVDKKTAVQMLEGLNQHLQNRIDNLDSEKIKEINNIKTSHQNTLRMKEHQIDEMKIQFKRRLEESTKSLESRIELANRQLEKTVHESSKKHTDDLNQEKSHHEKIVKALEIGHKKELHELNEKLNAAYSNVEYQKKYAQDSIKKKEQDMLAQFQQIIDKLEAEKESIKQNSEKNYAEAITTHEEKFSKLQNKYNDIENELFKHRLYSKRVKQDAEDIKSKCLSLLNNQKTDTDKVIAEREKCINGLKERLTNIESDYENRLIKSNTQLELTRSALEVEQKGNIEKQSQLTELQKRYEEVDRQRAIMAQNYEMIIEHINSDFSQKINPINENVKNNFKPDISTHNNDTEQKDNTTTK